MSPSSNLLALGLFVVASAPLAEACDCLPFWGNLCDLITQVDIVLRATVLERTVSTDINNDTIYSLQSVEVFKAENISEPEYAEGSTFDAAMPGNDGLCGINLDIDGDYLIDFYRLEEEIQAVGLCGLTREWSSVDAEDEAILREGCDNYDPCEGSCDEFQECKKGVDSSIGYYCEDTCDPSPCADHEECVLVYTTSCDLGEACGPEATCEQSSTMPSPSPGRFITLTLPPGASIESTTGGAGTPAPGELGDVITLPPGAVIDSTTDGTGAPSASELTYLPETLPPGVDIDSSTTGGGKGTPAPGELGDAMTLPPGAVIDSTTDGTGAPSASELGDAMTLPPDATVDSTTGPTGTPSPGELGDAMTLPPGAVIDSTTDGTGAPSASELGDVMTLPPDVIVDSTTAPTGTPAQGELGDAMTLPPDATVDSTSAPTGTPAAGELGDAMTLYPGATVDTSSTLKPLFPTLSPTASPTSFPSGEGGTDGSNGADGVGCSGFVWGATCLATIAAAAVGFGSVFGGRVLFAT